MTASHRIQCDKCDLAIRHLDRLWHEVFWRRENEQKISVWTIGLFGALLAIVYGREGTMDWPQKVVLSVFPIMLGIVSAWYLQKNWQKTRVLARIIVKLNLELGSWDEGYFIPREPLLPEAWKEWGQGPFTADRVSLLYMLLVIAASLLTAGGVWLAK